LLFYIFFIVLQVFYNLSFVLLPFTTFSLFFLINDVQVLSDFSPPLLLNRPGFSGDPFV